MSTATIRTVFIAGTVIFILVFLCLSYDTIGQLPARTNEQALTQQALAGKVAWQIHDCTDCHALTFWYVWRLIFGTIAVTGVCLYLVDMLALGLGPAPRLTRGSRPEEPRSR